MQSLTIFSYLPNPRVWKATIAARLTGVGLQVTGAAPGELAKWLWDPNPHELPEAERVASSPYARQGRRGFQSTLYKTDAFMTTQPFGTVPAAFGQGADGGVVGIFESNSILRAVAREANALYGQSSLSASRVDSFLDANLVFAREAQVYLLELQNRSLSAEGYQRMSDAYEFYLHGINSAIAHDDYLVDNELSIADISFACDFTQFQRELYFSTALGELDKRPISQGQAANVDPDLAGPNNDFANVTRYLQRLLQQPAIAEDLASYVEDLRGKLAHQKTKG